MGVEGVIRPPPEIRVVCDKTASYVAKNGRAFEARIIGSGKGKTPKFAFLQPTSPFHAYYEERIRFYENGGDDAKKEGEEDESKNESTAVKGEALTNEKDATKKKSQEKNKKQSKGEKSGTSSAAIDPVAKALLTQRSKISQARAEFEKQAEQYSAQQQPEPTEEDESPPPHIRKHHFVAVPPPPLELVQIMAPASLNISQVETIQLVAQFTALDGKGGPFFARLSHREWANPAFAFCQPRHGHFAYFSALVDAYRCIYHTWTKAPATESNHDIVHQMAGNVDKCLEMAAYRVAYEHDLEEQTRKQKAEDGEGVSDVAQIDWHDFVVVETIDFPADEKVELAMLPPPPPPKILLATANNATLAPAAGDEENIDESDDEGETIRVVPTYTPKVVSNQAANPMQEVIDPITGKSVPVKDMPEHMRIQLLDPKWAEERKKFQEKQKDSNLVSGDLIASNISRFARDTLRGKSEHDILSGETDAKKRLDVANRVLREQAQHGVGPSLPQPVHQATTTNTMPPPPPPPPPQPLKHSLEQTVEPEGKRQRLEGAPELAGSVAAVTSLYTPAQQPQQQQSSADPLDSTFGTADATNSDLLSPEDFIKTLSKPEITLQIRIPNDPSQMAWNFYGQIVSLSVNVKSQVKTVKQELSRAHLNGMPANKIQLKGATGFLKDNNTLAQLNIGPTGTVDMIPKTRGGRK